MVAGVADRAGHLAARVTRRHRLEAVWASVLHLAGQVNMRSARAREGFA
jgi:hypothetical protein